MDGLLVIDKPTGPTSHDVVARVRRAIGEPHVGHAGTLDPMASGVLLLLLGRATRLARFLSACDKWYDAIIRLGVATDTYDADGIPVGLPYDGPLPSRETLEHTLDAWRGSFLQRPPAFSAKKIAGRRSYKLARARRSDEREPSAGRAWDPTPAQEGTSGRAGAGESCPLPEAVAVLVHRLELVAFEGDIITLRLSCSAGFYVRSLAHDLGQRLGVSAHLAELRRTRSGDVTLADTLPLHVVERDPDRAAGAVVPLARMLPGLAPVVLTPEGARRATHGRDLGPGDIEKAGAHLFGAAADKPHDGMSVRLLDSAGQLIGIGEPARTPGLLHPSVVLR